MRLSRRSYLSSVAALSLTCLFLPVVSLFGENLKATYVGSDTCMPCHEAEYGRFKANARKAHSFESIQRMKKGLTRAEFEDCYRCHTTGYGEPSGFESVEKTPQLKDAGCEVCHGPASIHAGSGDPSDLVRKATLDVCAGCHNSERVATFRFKPMLYGGAH